jgi:hypothetical protein
MPDVSRNPEEAHDILAAEAFAVPAPDPALRRGLVLPDDPAGIAEPHDILAAEEFAMPAPHRRLAGVTLAPAGAHRAPRWTWIPGACLAALWVWQRRRLRASSC